jgi:hypothetical protein
MKPAAAARADIAPVVLLFIAIVVVMGDIGLEAEAEGIAGGKTKVSSSNSMLSLSLAA